MAGGNLAVTGLVVAAGVAAGIGMAIYRARSRAREAARRDWEAGRALASFAHEMRTPLTVISGFAETLLTVPRMADSDRHAAASAIYRRAQELTDVVERFIVCSQIEAGEFARALGPVDLAELVVERAAEMQAVTGRFISVEANDVPAALGDHATLAVVLDQLLDNAVKFSPAGEPVRVEAGVHESGGIWLSVGDAGVGMDHVGVLRCFGRYWQAEGGDRHRFGGTGVGLHIVSVAVAALGGSVSVESEPDVGSVFTVLLRPVGRDTAIDPRLATAARRQLPSLRARMMRVRGT